MRAICQNNKTVARLQLTNTHLICKFIVCSVVMPQLVQLNRIDNVIFEFKNTNKIMAAIIDHKHAFRRLLLKVGKYCCFFSVFQIGRSDFAPIFIFSLSSLESNTNIENVFTALD